MPFFRSILVRSWGWFWQSFGEGFGRQNQEKSEKIDPKTEKMRSKNGVRKRSAKKHQKSLQHKPVLAWEREARNIKENLLHVLANMILPCSAEACRRFSG